MRRFVAILGAALLVATACGQAAPTGTATSAAPSEQPVPGGRLVASLQGDPKTFQPVITGDTGSSAAWGWFYIGLITSDPKTGENSPGLAEKFGLSPDGLTLTYTLRDNLVWSDGSPFTGEDYKFTGEAILRSKKTSRKSNLDNIVGAKDFADGKADNITGITVKDGGKTIEVKLTTPLCTAISGLSSFGTGGIIPKKVFGKYLDPKDPSKNLDDAPENSAPPQMSMGPFIFKEFKPGVQVSYTKNPKYWKGAPLVDEFILRIYPDDTSIKNALVVGDIDYGGVAAKDYDEVVKVETLKGYEFPRLVYRYLGWGTTSPTAPFLKVKEVRQALWYALDVDALVKKTLFGHGSRIYAHSLPIQWSYDETGLNKYPYDQAKAKQLLEKAGAKPGSDGFYRWTDGKVMELKLETNQGNTAAETTIQYAAEQYKQIGIKATTTLESGNAFLDRVDPTTKDLEGFYLGWSLAADPNPYQIWHSSQDQKQGQFNVTHLNSPEVDKALEANRNGPDCSQAARKKALHTVDQILNDEAPYAFLYADNALTFINKKLRGTDPQTFSTTYNIEKWWVKQ